MTTPGLPRLVRDAMTTPVFTLLDTDTVERAAREMQTRNVGALPVVNAAGKLVGIITEGDFTGLGRCVPFSLDLAPVIFGAKAASPAELARIYEQARKLPLSQVMTSKVITAHPEEELGAAIRKLVTGRIKHLPVVEHGSVVGMLARHDLLKLMASVA